MAKKFKWNAWDFDGNGYAYVIAKSECLYKNDIPDYIVRGDCLLESYRDGMVIEEGWCKYQVRTDWEDCEGKPRGGYVVETHEPSTRHSVTGKRKPGWFPVWIVRKGDWY